MCATRRLRISAANIGPNRFHQNRTVSWLMSIPRSAKRSSTFRSDSGYRTYIITTRRITSGELLKYRNGLRMVLSYHGEWQPEQLLCHHPRRAAREDGRAQRLRPEFGRP